MFCKAFALVKDNQSLFRHFTNYYRLTIYTGSKRCHQLIKLHVGGIRETQPSCIRHMQLIAVQAGAQVLY